VKPKPKPRYALLRRFERMEVKPRDVDRRLSSFAAGYLDGRLFLAVKDGTGARNCDRQQPRSSEMV
jgi:hypothetical protein